MRHGLGVLVSVLALGCVSAQAQTPAQGSGQVPPASDLPVAGQAEAFTPIPGVGPTPGVILYVEDPSERCSARAKEVADGVTVAADALAVCSDAITGGLLTGPLLAGTYVNRGVLLMSLDRSAEAKMDFERALTLQPDLAEAYVNRGAILIAERRPAEGVADLDRGIALGPDRPERAHYNRALGREDLGDLKGAYADYRAAAALRPDWEPVLVELSRFSVRR